MNEDYKKRLNNFFNPLLFKFKIAFEVKKQTDRYLASDFNVINIIYPNENKLSDILVLLLSSEWPIGQGIMFLKNFIKVLKEGNRSRKS